RRASWGPPVHCPRDEAEPVARVPSAVSVRQEKRRASECRQRRSPPPSPATRVRRPAPPRLEAGVAECVIAESQASSSQCTKVGDDVLDLLRGQHWLATIRGRHPFETFDAVITGHDRCRIEALIVGNAKPKLSFGEPCTDHGERWTKIAR